MSRKFFASLVLVFVLCGVANASDWTSYFSVDLDDVGDYISGLFGKEKKENIASDEILPQHLASDWDNLTGDLSDALKLRDKNDSLPRKSWIPFKEDQRSNAKRINELLDAAMKILINGEAGNMRREAWELRERIAAQRVELDELRNKRINAPESSYAFWRMTREKADKKISALENEIKGSEQRLKDINSNLTTALKSIGLELDEAQTEILLNSVTGDDLLKNTIIFSNVKSVVAKLEALSQNDTNSLEITRRYTGMYLILNDLLIHTQEELVRKIDGDYKPKLNLIIAEADSLKHDALTKSNNKAYTPEQRKSFAANAKSNEMTIKVANLYAKLLDSQRASATNSIKSMSLNRDLAENTYRTVRSSGELKGLIHSGLTLFDALDNNLSMPELKIFESDVMRLEFEEINRRLKN